MGCLFCKPREELKPLISTMSSQQMELLCAIRKLSAEFCYIYKIRDSQNWIHSKQDGRSFEEIEAEFKKPYKTDREEALEQLTSCLQLTDEHLDVIKKAVSTLYKEFNAGGSSSSETGEKMEILLEALETGDRHVLVNDVLQQMETSNNSYLEIVQWLREIHEKLKSGCAAPEDTPLNLQASLNDDTNNGDSSNTVKTTEIDADFVNVENNEPITKLIRFSESLTELEDDRKQFEDGEQTSDKVIDNIQSVVLDADASNSTKETGQEKPECQLTREFGVVDEVLDDFVKRALERIDSIVSPLLNLEDNVTQFLGPRKYKNFQRVNEVLINSMIEIDQIDSNERSIIRKKKREALQAIQTLQDKLKP